MGSRATRPARSPNALGSRLRGNDDSLTTLSWPSGQDRPHAGIAGEKQRRVPVMPASCVLSSFAGRIASPMLSSSPRLLLCPNAHQEAQRPEAPETQIRVPDAREARRQRALHLAPDLSARKLDAV